MIKAELGNWLLIADDQWAEDNTAANFIDYPTTIPTRQIKDSFMELEIEAAQGNQLNLKTTFSKSGDVSITLMNIKGKSQTLFKGFQEKGTAQYAITPFAGSGVYYLFVNAKESKMKVGPLALH